MSKAPVVILEGVWWSNHEVPLVLPYFHALSISHRHIDVGHKSIRCVDDIAYYVSRIRKGAGAMLYFACHGEGLQLMPAGRQKKISREKLLEALGEARSGAISYVHFGCCEMVDARDRRQCHQDVLDATGAKWASGYIRNVDWLHSMCLDLALVSEVFASQHAISDGRTAQRQARTRAFMKTYGTLAKSLGFSALSRSSVGVKLIPERLREQRK